MKTINAKQLRAVTVLVRYFIKATQAVVLYIENDKGVRYYVRLEENGVNTCNCKATKECYHIKAAVNFELARPFAAKSLPAWAVSLVNTGKIEVPGKPAKVAVLLTPKPRQFATEYISDLEACAKITATINEVKERRETDMMNAALTTNQGFRLMR
jgi:hypothetical protein